MKNIILILLTIIFKTASSQEVDMNPPIVRMLNIKIYDSTTNSMIYNVKSDSLKKETNLFCLNNQTKIHFYFIGQVKTKPDQVKYKTKLVGYEKEWRPISSDNNVEYSNLKPGYYVFSILACNASGLFNVEIYKYKFKVAVDN